MNLRFQIPSLYSANTAALPYAGTNLLAYLNLLSRITPNQNMFGFTPNYSPTYLVQTPELIQDMIQPMMSLQRPDILQYQNMMIQETFKPRAKPQNNVLDQKLPDELALRDQGSQHLSSEPTRCDTSEIELENQKSPTQVEEKKDIWTQERVQSLLKWVQQCRYDWKKVAKRFRDPKITPFQVRSKYKLLTQKDFREPRIKFTLKEDLILAKYFSLNGTDWEKISVHFERRSAVMVKNRYYSHIRKKNILNKLLEKLLSIEKTNGKPVEELEVECLEAAFEEDLEEKI